MENLRYQRVIHNVILEQLGNGKKIALRVSGRSMHPLIKQGDPIYVEKYDMKELSIGDIITFKRNDLYITHRVLWIMRRRDGITLLTKGDNEINVDPPVSPSQILGKAAAVERGDRILNLESPPWRFINRLLGILFLVEMIFILSYRFAASKSVPFRTFIHTTVKPSLLYRHLRNRSLHFAIRIIM